MITPAAFSVFITNVNTMIGAAYAKTPIIYPKFVQTVPVTSAVLEFGWTGMLPKMRAWYGPRVTFEPAPQTYSVTMIPYESTVTIDRFALDDDQYGIYYRVLPDLGRQAARWPELELRDLLENSGVQTGSRQNGLDGFPNFYTAHPIDFYNPALGTYANDFTGGGLNVTYPKSGGGTVTTLVGGAFSPVAFATLLEFMTTYKGEDNEALGVTPSLIMHAPQLRAEVDIVLRSQFFSPPAWGTITGQVGPADNVFQRWGVNPLENPLLKNAATWYLMDTTKAFMPFGWGLRMPVVLTPRVNEDDPVVFDTHSYVWGETARAAPFWSFAWLCARSGP